MSQLETLFEATGGIPQQEKPATESSAAGTGASPVSMGSPPPEAFQEAKERMTAEDLEAVHQWFESDPEEVTSKLQDAVDSRLTEQQVRNALVYSRALLEAPGDGLEAFGAEESFFRKSRPLPEHFMRDYIRKPYHADIAIDPYDRRFEDDNARGLAGWVLWNGLPALKGLFTKKAFRWHDDYGSRFVYDLEPVSDGGPFRVALLADFGTGLYHSRFIARQLEVEDYDAAFHCGDVYYTGTRTQFWKYFEEPLAPTVRKKKTRVFLIADNHEAYSGFDGYFYYLDKQHALYPITQPQEGSYFCARGEDIQVIGLDTIWHERGRFAQPRLKTWLREQLEVGRERGLANVVLTGYHPYEYGEEELNPLLTLDLEGVVFQNLVDLWFWGNTHYCALFERSELTPFLGSCIGHGGYPYGLRKRRNEGDRPVGVHFFEDTPRFPKELRVRDDRGNNGYCVIEVRERGKYGIKYLDWMGNTRYHAELARQGGESHLSLVGVRGGGT